NVEIQRTSTGDLPEGWVISTLGEISTKPQYGWTTKANHESGEVKLLRTTDITSGKIDWASVPYCTKEPDDLKKYFLKAGDIVISRAGSVGVSYLLTDTDNAVFASYLIRFRPIEPVNKKYVYYFLKSPDYWKAIGKSTLGIAVPNVNATKLAKVKIPIATPNEQKRIVAEIEKQFSRLDEAVDNLKRVKANLKRYKASVLKAAVEGKLTEEWRKKHPEVEHAAKLLERILADRRKKWEEAELAKIKAKGKEPTDDKWKKKYKEPLKPDLNGLPKLPDGWVWSSVDCLGEIVTGTTPSTKKKEYYGGDIPFFKPTELNQGYSVTSAAVYLTEVGAEKARLIPPHSVMVTCIGATIGKVGFSRVHGTTNQQLNTLIPDKRYLYSQYLFFACISPFFFKKIIDNASSTTLPIINKSKFAVLPIMVPPFKEQTIIVDEIERCLSIIDEVNLAVDVCVQRAGHLCQSILKKAFSGKLVDQDSNDESARKLLGTIKAKG
ncbi:MAG: restriction endonuclease subunit S, partial [Thermodesulfobacteriota bacterium]|nr:restriction endonuclease subunit S [Thermodesulfobacteriota bacterium]